jgi:flagellar biosynthesis anti-sigma factor FlgM
MKIDGHGPNSPGSANEAQSTQANERVQSSRAELPGRAPEASGDRVKVSDDARLLNTAVQAAERAPEIRQDVVERARQKLADGEVGTNPYRLADRIIDSLLAR